jgi:hypothetical protein
LLGLLRSLARGQRLQDDVLEEREKKKQKREEKEKEEKQKGEPSLAVSRSGHI